MMFDLSFEISRIVSKQLALIQYLQITSEKLRIMLCTLHSFRYTRHFNKIKKKNIYLLCIAYYSAIGIPD